LLPISTMLALNFSFHSLKVDVSVKPTPSPGFPRRPRAFAWSADARRGANRTLGSRFFSAAPSLACSDGGAAAPSRHPFQRLRQNRASRPDLSRHACPGVKRAP
jgi:hypothetical protein